MFAPTFKTMAFHANTSDTIVEQEGKAGALNPMHVMKPLLRQFVWPEKSKFTSISVPTLVIAGESDGITPKEGCKTVSEWIPNTWK